MGTSITARNVVLQQAPTGGSWSATTKLSIGGTDDYVQGGIIAHASASDWGKLVVMRRPTGEWVLELARASGYQNSAALPVGAQDGITLQMFASEGRLRGRFSLDDGATWTEVGTGFALTGLSTPGIGLAAFNGTGAEVGSFERFSVGEPPLDPETCTAASPDPGYTMLFDGTRASVADWRMAGSGTVARASDCTLFTEGGLGMLWHSTPIDYPYSLKLDWKLAGDDNSGVFVGFPDSGTDPNIAINQGYEVQIDATDDPDSTTGAIYNFQAARRGGARLRPEAAGRVEQLRAARRGQADPRLPERRADQRLHQHRARAHGRRRRTSACRTTATATTSGSATCRSGTSTAPQLRDSTTTATADPAAGQGRPRQQGDRDGLRGGGGADRRRGAEVRRRRAGLRSVGRRQGHDRRPACSSSAGTKTLTAAYAGDATTKPSTGSVEITVVPHKGKPGGGGG